MAGDPAELAEPTELAGVADAGTESAYAWSQADVLDEEMPTPRLTPRRITATALAGCLAVIAGAGLVAYFAIRDARPALITQPSATPTVTIAPAASPQPSPSFPSTKPKPRQVADAKTLEPPPPPPKSVITATEVEAFDRQFIANLKSRGWEIWDPLTITQQAHQVCASLENGASATWVVQQLSHPPTTPTEAQQFVTVAMLTYPACPP